MSTLTDGYITDIAYTYGYYKELNPMRFIVPFLQMGYVPPQVNNACELGFGQGLSINFHAASSEVHWYGTDFNYAQTAFAKDLAEKSASNVHLAGQSFEQFCQRDDLPEFNFIGLHGIWSWISDENRHLIVDFIDRKLAIGGVVYISYNTLPGWSTSAPLRHLLSLYNQNLTSHQTGFEQNLKDAYSFCESILTQSPKIVHHLPQIQYNLTELQKHNANYIAHEYFNQNWQPMYFSELYEYLHPIRLEFICSSNYLEDFNGTLFTTEQAQLVNQQPTVLMQQTVKDFILNRQFRRDYWVKGARKYNAQALSTARGNLRFMLVTTREQVNFTLSAHRQTALITEKVNPLLDILADYQPHFVNELFDKLAESHSENEIFLILTLLYSANALALIQNDEKIAAVRPHCVALNQYILSQSTAKNTEVTYLVSPLNGEAIGLSQLELLFLYFYAQQQGENKLQNTLTKVWEMLQKHGQVMKEQGEAVQGNENNLAALQRWAESFLADKYLQLQRLEVI